MEVLRDQVSVVLQNNVLFSGTILDNLRWGDKEATLEECRHACELACADEFIDRFRKDMRHTSSRAEVTYPEVRSRDYVLQEHYLRSQKY